MSPTFDPTSVFDDVPSGAVVRRASANDVNAILDLRARAYPAARRMERTRIEELVRHGWFLLVEHAVDGVIAAVHVRLHGRVGHISMLTMDPAHRRHGLATQLLGVADALCAVFGCTPYEESAVDVAA